MSTPTGILVIGAHRSGTSAIARTLGLMGAAEASRLMPANGANPSGYWEAEAAVAANDRFLCAVGSRWDDPRPLPAAAFSGRAAQAARGELARFIEAEFGAAACFVLKDPRFCRTAPLALGALADVGARALVVSPLRSPEAAARSLMARDGYSETKCVAIWLGGVLAAERLTRGVGRHFVGYERFARDPAAGARALAGELGCFDAAAVAKAAAPVAEYWAAAGAPASHPPLAAGALAELAARVHAALRSDAEPEARALDEAAAEFIRLLRSASYRRAAMGDALRELADRVARKVAGG